MGRKKENIYATISLSDYSHLIHMPVESRQQPTTQTHPKPDHRMDPRTQICALRWTTGLCRACPVANAQRTVLGCTGLFQNTRGEEMPQHRSLNRNQRRWSSVKEPWMETVERRHIQRRARNCVGGVGTELCVVMHRFENDNETVKTIISHWT